MGFFPYAQDTQLIRLNNNSFLQKNKLKNPGSVIHFITPLYAVDELKNTTQTIPEDFYTKNMGFFCKQELIIEKATRIPLRFRLGTLQQCNYYEGKKQ